jgi:hypothetical protein
VFCNDQQATARSSREQDDRHTGQLLDRKTHARPDREQRRWHLHCLRRAKVTTHSLRCNIGIFLQIESKLSTSDQARTDPVFFSS